jgi:DNA-binding NtrC family response regulator
MGRNEGEGELAGKKRARTRRARKQGTVARLMVVERAHRFLEKLKRVLPEGEGFEIRREQSIDRVLEHFERDTYDILLVTGSAVGAGDTDGMELLEVITAKSPGTQILLLVEADNVEAGVSGLKAGGYHYARLPIDDGELKMLIMTALEEQPRYGPNLLLKRDAQESEFEDLIGRSREMKDLYRHIRQAAATDIPVLLVGETGTGKDLAGRAIHNQSDRRGKDYVPVHLGALPVELVASELFGHEKGAFTGATEKRKGKFELASDGTVFLDEISTVDAKVQVSLLRLIEQRRFRRLGGSRNIRSDARVIAATNQDLAEAVREGRFRKDLYYRLDVFRIVIPSLRERASDIALLVEEFLGRYNREFKKSILGIAPGCMGLLESYDWPGNVRELKNVVQRAVLVCTGEVLMTEHLPPRFRRETPLPRTMTFDVGTPLDQVERDMVLAALDAADGNKTEAAALLGISRRALYNKLKKYRIPGN